MKKIFAILALALFVCAVGGYFALMPGIKEKQAEKVAAFLQDLPGDFKAERIAVEPLVGNVILYGFSGHIPYFEGAVLSFTVDEVLFKGLDPDAAKGGVALLVKGIRAREARYVIESRALGAENPLREEVRAAMLTLDGVHGDFGSILNCARTKAPAADYLRAAGSFSIDSLAVTGYSSEADVPPTGVVRAEVGGFTIRQAQLFGTGKAVWEDLRLSFDGRELLRLDLVTLESSSIPNLLEPLLALEAGGSEDALLAEYLAVMEREALILKNLEFKNLRYGSPDSGKPLTAARLGLDLDASTSVILVKAALEDLVIPPEYYRLIGNNAAALALAHAADLNVSGGLDVDIRHRGGEGEITVKSLSLADKNLGSLRGTAALAFDGRGDAEHFDSGVDFLLQRAEVVLEDRTFVDAYLKMTFADQGALDAARLKLMRGHLAQGVRADAAAASSPDEAGLLQGVADILAAPGRLSVTLEADAPLPLPEDGTWLPQGMRARVAYEPLAGAAE